MKRVLFASLLLATAAGACVGAHASAPTLRDAQGLYFQSKLPEAEAALKAVSTDPAASATDRAGAERDLARIAWLIDQDAPRALAALDRGRAAGAELCRTTLMQVRVLDESGRPRDAAMFAQTHAADCPGEAQGTDLKAAEAKAWIDLNAATPGGDPAAVTAADAALSGLSPLAEASPKAQQLRLGFALAAGAPDKALDAFRGFFWLTDHNAPEPFGLADAEVARRFTAGLAPDASAADQSALLALLVRAGFYEEAKRFDAGHGVGARAGDNADYRNVRAYFALRADIDPLILAFNRATARGKHDDDAFRAQLTARITDAAHRLDPSAKDPRPVLQKAFGLFGTIGATGGFGSMHAGHVVQDERMVIDQYGRKGEVRFIVVENMISNGYQSWLWDGGAMAGGWSGEAGTIVQVRPAYSSGSLNALASFDPEIARRMAARQPELERQDLAALAQNPVAYLPGLQARLTRQSRERIAAAARAEAARSGQPYPRVFARLYWDAEVGHSIRLHEGRHSLDNFQFTGVSHLTSPELEFRAKLSELEMATYPRMPLSNILSSEIGSHSPHGEANTRIMTGYLRWMSAHKAQVAGFDPKVPVLEQLDKLTDQQIRDVAHDLDPQFQTGR